MEKMIVAVLTTSHSYKGVSLFFPGFFFNHLKNFVHVFIVIYFHIIKVSVSLLFKNKNRDN